MARRKSHFKFKIPLLKSKFKINRRTFFTIIGLLIISFGLLCLLSFMQSGALLTKVNTKLIDSFGSVSLLFPIIMILFATHFFNSPKLKLIKFHVSAGLCFIFIAALGFLRAGRYGQYIFENLKSDFSFIGAMLVLFITLVVGGVIFLNTSLDELLVIVVATIKKVVDVISTSIVKPLMARLHQQNAKKVPTSAMEHDFLQEKAPLATHATPAGMSVQPPKQDVPTSTSPILSDF